MPQYIEKCVEKNIKIIAFKIGNSTSTNTSFNKIREIYENHKWSSRATAAGTIDRVPEEWKFSAERLDYMFRTYGQ